MPECQGFFWEQAHSLSSRIDITVERGELSIKPELSASDLFALDPGYQEHSQEDSGHADGLFLQELLKENL